MDSGTALVGGILILICILPFVLMNMSAKKKKRQFLQLLFDLAGKNNGKISQHDHWNGTAIGLDETTNTIFFIKKLKEDVTSRQVNLAEVQKCRVVQTHNAASGKGGSAPVIEKIELAFAYRDKGRAETTLEFYNDETDSFLSGELQQAEKWSKIANARIAQTLQQPQLVK
ncbi:MAG: hypothetical protein KF852_00220 [Saprospiraceae bacterium]|nr:hypothetical protein [Saprospiraceae bacterium]